MSCVSGLQGYSFGTAGPGLQEEEYKEESK